MLIGVARGIFAISALLALMAGIAAADQFLPADGGWQTYINDRFGARFDYPADVFSPEAPPENGDGRTFKAGDATLQIFAFHNIEDESPASLKRRLVGTEGYDDVTYSPSGQSWLVLSGFRGNRIFYEKYAFGDGVISAFGIEFAAEEKPYFAPIIERIEDSFEAGRSD
jgi:hypothetical protein